MNIRATTTGDADEVGAVLGASYPVLMKGHYEAAVLARALPLMVRANPVLLSSGRYFAACDGAGAIIACGGWSHECPGSGRVTPGLGHIRHFAVHPDHTGQGLGRALFAACRSQAREEGLRTFACFSSLNAEQFYTALGFIPIGPVAIAMGAGLKFPSIHMSLAI